MIKLFKQHILKFYSKAFKNINAIKEDENEVTAGRLAQQKTIFQQPDIHYRRRAIIK